MLRFTRSVPRSCTFRDSSTRPFAHEGLGRTIHSTARVRTVYATPLLALFPSRGITDLARTACRAATGRMPSECDGWKYLACQAGSRLVPMLTAKEVIHTDPEILAGEPVFAGTRVPLRNLFDYLEAGDSLEIFLDAFPDVTRDQAVAALELARQAVSASAGSR